MAAEAPFEQVGKAFVQHYYQTFDANRAGLASLYQSDSMYSPPDRMARHLSNGSSQEAWCRSHPGMRR